MIIEFIDRIPELFSPWVYVPLFFVLWLFIALGLKQFLIKRLLRAAERTAFKLDDLLINSLSAPLSIVIFGVGVLFVSRLLPLTPSSNHVFTVAFQCSVIFSIVIFIDRFLNGLVHNYQAKIQVGISPTIAKVLLRTAVFGTGALIFLSTIGISITPVLASLGLGSLAVGLALQDTLANLFAGIHIAFDKPVRVGDYIKLESGEEGYVTEIGWRSTRILMLSNNMVILPNNKLTSALITNYYLPEKEMAVLVDVGVHYQNNLEEAERVTVEVAREILKKTPGGVPNFEPFIRYHTFAPLSINFTVVLRGREFVDQHLLKHEFIKALQDRYRKEGIVLSYGPTALEVAPKMVEMFQSLPKPLSK